MVQIMAWRRPGDKPLSEPMMVSLPTHICVARPQWVNSLAPGRPGCHFKTAIFNLVLLIGIFISSNDNPLRWMSWDLTNKSTLVQVMAWCRQATSHYLSQCWPSSMLPYGVTRPQCVNTLRLRWNGRHFADNIFKFIVVFCFRYHWILLQMIQLTVNIGSDNGLVLNRRQAIIWTDNGLINLHIYV